jgi:death on curing protein
MRNFYKLKSVTTFCIKDYSLLSSALAMPNSMFDGQYIHQSIIEKSAAYIFYLTQNHCFIDGNKRIGLASGLVFLELNGISIEDKSDEFYPLVMKVAEGKSSKKEIVILLEKLSVQ